MISARLSGASRRWLRTGAFVASSLLSTATVGAGVGAGKEFQLPNAGFDLGLRYWTPWTSDGLSHLAPSAGPSGGRRSVRCELPAGVQASLSLALPVSQPSAANADRLVCAAEGDKLEFGAWVYLDGDCTAGDVYLEVLASDGFSTTTIAESLHLDAAGDPHGAWVYLHTIPAGMGDARIPAGATNFTLVLHARTAGTLWFDDVQGGIFEYAEFSLKDPSFEDPSVFASAWLTQGSVGLSNPTLERDTYYGRRYLKLGGLSNALAAQPIAISAAQGAPAPGQVTEACGWFYLDSDVTGLGANANPALWVRLTLSAWTQGTPLATAVVLAEKQWNPTLSEAGAWTFLQTTPSATAGVPYGKSYLWVTLEKSLGGTVRVDFVQAGERFAVNGNPRRHVACNYVGWYRSPLFPGATTNPTGATGIWRNWAWLTPPPCNPAYRALLHNPDCATNPSCVRMNLRRDGATSLESTQDDLPLAGTYDSRDPDLLRYHVRLAQAIGIDSFVYDHQGHTLAQQSAASGAEPINETAFEELLAAAEEPGSSLKIAVMYEPKVHFNGWVQNEPTLALKKAGIEADLTHLCATYFRRKGLLKHDGRLVVYVFRNTICNGDGTQCMQDSDWQEIVDGVESATGRELCLIADAQPSSASPFRGMSRWKLAALSILKYRTFADLVNRVASWPPPAPAALEVLASESNAKNMVWARADDRNRFGVPVVWPGFDDSGVAGWASTNLTGDDGQPLCVRVGSELGGGFFATSWSSALRSGCDWVQIATWNDWNEGTQIEPRWNATYAQNALAGVASAPWVLQQAFQRAFETQSAIAVFKGLAPGAGSSPADIDACAANYLRTAGVTYD